jgi:hypothetical protein
MARAMTPPPNNEDAQRASKIGTRTRKKEEPKRKNKIRRVHTAQKKREL